MQAVASARQTAKAWQKDASLYGENTRNTVLQLIDLLNTTVGLSVDPSIKGVLIANETIKKSNRSQQLTSLDKDRRAEGLRASFGITAEQEPRPEIEPLISRIADIGESDPYEAGQVLELLGSLIKSENIGRSNFAQAIPVGIAAIVALSTALTVTTTTPDSQERIKNAANAVAQSVAESGQSVDKQVTTSIEIWKFLFGTSFPVHLLDDKNSRLVSTLKVPILLEEGMLPVHLDRLRPARSMIRRQMIIRGL